MVNPVILHRNNLIPTIESVSGELSADLGILIDFTTDEICVIVRRPSEVGDWYEVGILPHSIIVDIASARKWIVSFVERSPFCNKDDGMSVSDSHLIDVRDLLLPGLRSHFTDDIELDIHVDFEKRNLILKAWCHSKRVLEKRIITVPMLQKKDYRFVEFINSMINEIAAKEKAA